MYSPVFPNSEDLSPEEIDRWSILQATVIENPFIPEYAKDGLNRNLKQVELLTYQGREVLYGGAAGGGKSFGMLMAAAQYVMVPGYHALIIRRTYAMLGEAKSVYKVAEEWWQGDPRVKHNAAEHLFTFPSGATIKFGHMQHEKDKINYQGGAYSFVGYDELTHFPKDSMYLFLFTRQRSDAGDQVPLRTLATANPGGPGHAWVKARFIDPETRDHGADFIPAKLSDNQNLNQSSYVDGLNKVDSLTRRQMLDGDWNAVEGARFKVSWFANRWEFDPDGQHILLKDHRGLQRFLFTGGRDRFGTADGAASAKTSADDSAFAAWLTSSPFNDLVSFGFHLEKLEIPDQPAVLEAFYRRHGLHWCGIEGVASNVALLQFAQRRQMVIRRLTPKAPVQGAGKDKLSRAFPAIALAEAGRIWLPSAAAAARIGYPLKRVIDQLVSFTGVEGEDTNDDVVDNFSYAVEAYNAFPHISKGQIGPHGVGGLPALMPGGTPGKPNVGSLAPKPRSLTGPPTKPIMGVGGLGVAPPRRY